MVKTSEIGQQILLQLQTQKSCRFQMMMRVVRILLHQSCLRQRQIRNSNERKRRSCFKIFSFFQLSNSGMVLLFQYKKQKHKNSKKNKKTKTDKNTKTKNTRSKQEIMLWSCSLKKNTKKIITRALYKCSFLINTQKRTKTLQICATTLLVQVQ